jgi:hypothetical protein
MIDEVIRTGGLSGRQAATALGVTEGALRYRRRRLAEGARDRRADQTTALDGYEEALTAVVEAVTEHSNAATPEHFKRGHVVGGESMPRVVAGAQA